MTPLQRWLLHVSLALLVVSGVSFAVMKYLLVPADPYSAAGHPLQPWALSLHVLSGPLAIFAIGWIFHEHIAGRRRPRNGRSSMGSGLLAAGLLVPMIASGYFLEVVTNETLRKALVVVHLICGGLYVAFYVAHLVKAHRRPAIFVLVALGATAAGSAASPCDGVERARNVMGSLARVVICEPEDEASAAEAAAAALDAFDRVDRTMSLYKPDSDLSRLNRESGGAPVPLDPDLVELLAAAGQLSVETGGAFDVTIKPLMDHFGFYRELGFDAPPGGLAGALALVGSGDLVSDVAAHTAFLRRPGMGIDLGGIAKGFALDRAAEELRRRGVHRAFLDLGRNLMFVGPGPLPEGRWRAGITDPAAEDGVAACIDVPEGALSTSALSGRMRGGVGHILDPRRGPVEGRVLQTTVWSRSATRADALSTALFLLDVKRARKILGARDEAAVVYRPRRLTIGPVRLSRCD